MIRRPPRSTQGLSSAASRSVKETGSLESRFVTVRADRPTASTAQRKPQHRRHVKSTRAVKEELQEGGGDDDPVTMHHRSDSGSQAARLADHLVQAPLEPRGVIANLFDKIRVCLSLAKVAYSHVGKGASLV